MGVGAQTVMKWVAAGAVAAIVSTIGFFSDIGTPLVQGLVMLSIGVGVLFLIGPKKLGFATSIPAGFMIAGGILLANEYVVPNLRLGPKTA